MNSVRLLLIYSYLYFLSIFVLLLPVHCQLDVHCNATEVSCSTIVSNAIIEFTGGGNFASPTGYDANVIPVPTVYTDDFEDSMMQVGMSLQFDSIEDVDELGAQLVLSIHMTVVWRDNFIYWNASDTPGCHYLYVPEKWLWKPDITLVNAAKDFEESMMPTDIFVTSELTALRASENVSGNAFQARPGIISSICKMDFTDFPFDTQHCTLTFSSNMYGSWPGGIALSFIENATYGFNGPGTLVRDTFESTSWKVVSVTSYSTLELRPYFGYTTMLHWEVTLSRFTSYYYATAIAPNLAITTIALLALWISDLGSRLGLTITAMLTVVAVLWSVSDALPATQTTTWLAQFSMYCICIVGTVILETCLCAYLSSELRKGPIPPWCRHVITGSKIFHHAFYSRRTPSSSRTESTAKSGRDVENANTEDMSGLGDVALNAMHKGNSSVDDSNRNNGCVTPSVVPSENAAESVVVKSVDNCASRVNAVSAAKSTISLTQKTPLLIEPCDLDETDYIQGRGMDNEVHLSNDMSHKSEWVQLSHAIDRFARVLFPLVFVIMAITMFARVT